MMRSVLILLASSMLCLALAARGATPHLLFQYELAGGPPASTHYIIKLFSNGNFSASTEGLPFTKTGLTLHKFTATFHTRRPNNSHSLHSSQPTLNPAKRSFGLIVSGRYSGLHTSTSWSRDILGAWAPAAPNVRAPTRS